MYLRSLIALAAAAIATALLAACGSAGTSAVGSSPAKPLSCSAQYRAWKHGPVHPAAKRLQARLRVVTAASRSEDIPALRTALRKLGPAVRAVQAYPMPKCADPAGYWPKMLAYMKASADNAGTATGLAGILLAVSPLKHVQPVAKKLQAELRRTAGLK